MVFKCRRILNIPANIPVYGCPAGKAALTTLVARDEQSRSCGPLGRYLVGPDALRPPRRHEPLNTDCNANNMPAYARLNVGCTAHDTLELEASCPLDDVTSE